MDNLNEILSSLSDEDIESLKSVAGELMGGEKPDASNSGDLELLLKAKDIMSKMNAKGNKNADLISALKPHLSDKSKEKADNAARMLRLFEILPYLKDLF